MQRLANHSITLTRVLRRSAHIHAHMHTHAHHTHARMHIPGGTWGRTFARGPRPRSRTGRSAAQGASCRSTAGSSRNHRSGIWRASAPARARSTRTGRGCGRTGPCSLCGSTCTGYFVCVCRNRRRDGCELSQSSSRRRRRRRRNIGGRRRGTVGPPRRPRAEHTATTTHRDDDARVPVDLIRVRVRRHVVEDDAEAPRECRDLLIQAVQVEAALDVVPVDLTEEVVPLHRAEPLHPVRHGAPGSRPAGAAQRPQPRPPPPQPAVAQATLKVQQKRTRIASTRRTTYGKRKWIGLQIDCAFGQNRVVAVTYLRKHTL
jgi:hypothetical protein